MTEIERIKEMSENNRRYWGHLLLKHVEPLIEKGYSINIIHHIILTEYQIKITYEYLWKLKKKHYKKSNNATEVTRSKEPAKTAKEIKEMEFDEKMKGIYDNIYKKKDTSNDLNFG